MGSMNVSPLNINLGAFIVPQTGTWTISFSIESGVSGGYSRAFLYHNGKQIFESLHQTGSGNEGGVDSTGGREVHLTAEEGDILTLRTQEVNGSLRYILICFEFNA